MPKHADLLERIALALEQLAQAASNRAIAPETLGSTEEDVRDALMERFEGQYITIDQAREALAMHDTSSKAIGMLLSDAGFERKRRGSGITFAICEPGGTCEERRPIILPENIAQAAEQARAAKAEYGRKIKPEQLIYGAFLTVGKEAKRSQVTPAHVAEVRRLFPDLFDD